ncbi:citrate-Mg2+:H+ or citrate-Ca2+:H+ symporter, CitMHS family [Acidaminococcus fermentans]|uniref:Citrate-Mg2+:H+ or citrate-Ca2+:H+ symporter, CitMHS family n=1 Tax=Acidaminococcus fermentans TaxID=905 RepID=A0A1H2WU82_ACIFE|nr:SLC13 family permease [Acidaminococcus fermentans]SDW83814.1 citrate-Mg2+:H+ or citrate-Ca2+:H+ symporter, CitMHS family [Acidaminococcus fermentans]
MSFAALVGFVMMILITTLLLKKKVSTLFAFTIIPIIGAFLLGASVKDVCDYVKFGLGKTRDLMFIIFFSLPYFSLMNEVGLFDTMVEFLLKRTKLSVTIVMIITVFVSLITEIDGSVTSTYLVTVPMMLPLYKKLKIDPKCLLLLCSATMCALFITPWNGRTLRAATLLDGIPAPQNYIFVHMLPLMLIYIAMCLGLAVLLARFQMKKGAGQVDESVIMEDLEKKDQSELRRPKLFWFNLLLTVLLIVGLSVVPAPGYVIFALGLVIALTVNYPDLNLQNQLLKKYSKEMYSTACAVFLSGVVVGVLSKSGMMDAMVQFLVGIIPSVLGPWVYLIIAIFSAPLMLIFTNDIWQYALVPIVAGVSANYGVPKEIVVMTLLMNMGAMVSPVAQPQIYLACDLADQTELQDYVKFSFVPLWVMNIIWLAAGYVLGIFR